jgi:transposase-like protein
MGTYHPMTSATSGAKQRQPRRGITHAAMKVFLEDMIAHAETSMSRLSKKHGLGVSTTSNWFNVYPNRGGTHKPQRNLRVAAWLKGFTDGENNLARLLKARPEQRIAPLILQEVADAVALHDASDSVDVGNERLVGPTGIGTFVPGTTDDLLVVKEAVLTVKAEAEAVVLQATTLSAAIDTVRDWLTDKDKLQLALGRIQSLEAQLKEADEIQRRFQQSKLANNQIHSND